MEEPLFSEFVLATTVTIFLQSLQKNEKRINGKVQPTATYCDLRESPFCDE